MLPFKIYYIMEVFVRTFFCIAYINALQYTFMFVNHFISKFFHTALDYVCLNLVCVQLQRYLRCTCKSPADHKKFY